MIDLGRNRFLVEPHDPLPELRGRELFADFETTSFNRKVEAFRPYNGHRACGVAVTVDDDPRSFYVPFRHRTGGLNHPRGIEWFRDLLKHFQQWINANVKFDAHFAVADG